MKTDVQNLSTTRVKIVVEIPFDELAEDLKEAYRTIASQVNVPGFRKGKIPARIIDQRFGRGTVLSEVANAVIPRTYDKIVADEELVPLGQPQVEVTKLEDGDFIEFVAEVDVRPEFDLPPLESVSVTVESVSADEDAVDKELLDLRKRFASFKDVERPSVEGDVVVVDAIATDPEGTVLEPFSATALTYEVGSGNAVAGFDEAVTGAVADEERTFAYTPEEGDFAGTPLTVSVTVKSVRETDLPEADDDFATMASEFDTVEELREDLRKRVRRAGLFQQGAEARDKVREAYLELVEIDLPEQLIADQVAEHFADGHGDEGHRSDHEAELRDNLKANLVFDKLAEEQEVRVEESELTQWLINQASRYGMTPDQFANALVSGGQVQVAIAEVRRAKALSLVVEAASITDAEGNAVSLEAIARTLSGGELDEADESPVEVDEVIEEPVAEAEPAADTKPAKKTAAKKTAAKTTAAKKAAAEQAAAEPDAAEA